MMRRRFCAIRPLTLLLGAALAAPASAAITATWFDVNPSSSNDGQNGASGGRINHVGAAADLSAVYAATEWGGLYKSFDQGNSWVRINTFSAAATWDVKVDPNDSTKVYATSSFDGRVNSQAGISVSTDSGVTWTPVNIQGLNTLQCGVNGVLFPARVTQPSAWQISINPNNTQHVFVGTSCGLARTLDGGKTWTFIDPSPKDFAEQVYAVLTQGQQTVDVISDNGHFRSTDDGGTWSAAPVAGLVAGNSGPGDTIAASPAESYVLLAASAGAIFESDDGGTTWPSALTLPLLSGGGSNVQGRIPFIKTNQLSTSNQFDVWFGDINVFKTTGITPSTAAPGGTPRVPVNSWTNMQSNAHWDSGDVGFDPRAAAGACPMWYTSDGGVFVNTKPNNPDCQTPNWSAPAITPHATWLWGFDGVRLFPGTHALTYGLQDDGDYAATTAMEGFSPPTPNWNNFECCDVVTNTEGAGRVVSLEGFFKPGRPFQVKSANQDGSGDGQIPNYPSVQNLTAFVSGTQVVPFGAKGYVVNMCSAAGCAGGDVYFTSDITAGTINWTSLGSPVSATTGTGSVKVASVNGSANVYYQTSTGDPEALPGVIFRAPIAAPPAGAATPWTLLPLPKGITGVTVYDVDPTNGNRLIISGINAASSTFEIWKTPDFGNTWTRVSSLETAMLGAPGQPVFVNQVTQGPAEFTFNGSSYWEPSLFRFDPLDSTTIIAGAMDAGVFVSIDDGTSWTLLSSPINPTSQSPHIPRPLFAYFSPGRFDSSTGAFDVWVGTRGAGVMKVVIETSP